MKNLLLLILLLPVQLFAQEKCIAMTNEKGKVMTIKENKRIKVITEDGERYFGRVHIIDEAHIVMRKDTIAMGSVVKIQKRSALKSALSTVIIVASSLAIPGSVYVLFADLNTAGVLFVSGSLGLPVGILLPVLGKNYNKKHWKFEILSP